MIHVGRVHARAMRSRRDGRWYWQARRGTGRERECVWTGWGTREEAEAELVRVVAGLPEGRPDVEEARTVHDLLDYWVAAQEDRGDLSAASVDSYRRGAMQVSAVIGEVRCDRLDRSGIERLRDALIRAGGAQAAGTAHHRIVVLRLAWRWGREVGLAPDRELPRVRIVRRPVLRRAPSAEEILRVLDALSSGRRRPAWWRRAVWLLWATGCRRGELAGLRWGDVDVREGVIRVRGKRGERAVPLAASVAREIGTWERGEHGARVWPVASEGFATGLALALAEGCELAGVEPITPQSIRRSAVDALYRAGVDVGSAAAVLGHSPAVALRHYRQATERDLRGAVERAGLGVVPEGDVVHLAKRRRGDQFGGSGAR